MWFVGVDMIVGVDIEVVWLEFQVIVVLMFVLGVYLFFEFIVCIMLSSVLYYCGGEVGLMRQLIVEVDVNRRDINCVDVWLWCLLVFGDGLGLVIGYDGGFFGFILVLVVKGEMLYFQFGFVLEVVFMDVWCWDENLVF